MSVWSGVPILGLDALASAAYGPEAALTVLLPAGASGIEAMGPITIAIGALLLALFFSYRQTIGAYPQGGGSYTVAKENLGARAGLLAASALALDYILNVAVAISAGVGAVVSAAPVLLPYTLPICLALLAFLTIINLRGVRATGRAFAIPTFLFVVTLVIALALAVAKGVAAGGGTVRPMSELPRQARSAREALGAWLALRAFASGCTAMTGVEAVSNAVPAFREPRRVHARRTLAVIVAILVVLLVGIALSCRFYGIGATEPGSPGFESVLSQIVRAVTGRNWFYYLTMASVVSVLCLSANTSFADFPRLCRVLARDGFMPARFSHPGPRFVFVAGIVLLTGLAAMLLVIFRGVTDRLIPLFAIGAFLAFTLSQVGMVFHWRRRGGRGWRGSLVLNGAGALATGATTIVVAVSKFREGAWISVVLIPIMLGLFSAMRRARNRIERSMAAVDPLTVGDVQPPVMLVPLHRFDRASRQALAFACSISSDVHCIELLTETADEDSDLEARWPDLVERPAAACGRVPPRLVVVRSKYRELVGPLVEHARRLAKIHPDRPIAVLMPERVGRRWYHELLRSHRATRLRRALLVNGEHGIIVIESPWFLDD